tara:strand:- start:5328 stop:7310 length:1983 start_codon:yes stop_codon:yes gene_type:complete
MIWVTPSVGLLVAAITFPLLLLLYFLRLRRQPVRIASTMLWHKAVEDLHANSPFQRLRPSVLLLLQLFALLLVILAIMQPQIEGSVPREGRHVILIDRSGSMAAENEDGTTRLEQAKEEALVLIDQLYGGGLFSSASGESMVIGFSDQANIYAPFTDSKQQLTSAILGITQSHGKSFIGDSLQLARGYMTNVNPESEGVSSSESASLELFSDGNIEDFNGQSLANGESLRYHMVGEPTAVNVGIAMIDAKRLSEKNDNVQVFLSLINTALTPMTQDVELSIDGVPIGVQETVIPSQEDGVPGRSSVVFVPFPMQNSGLIQAKIIQRDVLSIDNQASLVIPPPKEIRVLLSENGAPILQTVLEGMALEELKVVSSSSILSMIQEGQTLDYDVVVTRDIELPTLPLGNFFVFGAPPPLPAFASFVKGDTQVMLVADEEHPTMRFVRYEDIVVTEGYDVVQEGSSQVLLEGSSWPAVMTVRTNGRQVVYVAFDPMNSNWPYLRSFPFFVFNTIEYLGRSGEKLTSSLRSIGGSLTESVRPGDVVSVIDSNGIQHSVTVDSHGSASWGPIESAGVHILRVNEETEIQIAVNSPEYESIVSSVETVVIGTNEIETTQASKLAYIQLWPWALGAVLAVLLVEWWVYQKKVSTPLMKSLAEGSRGIR